MKIKLTDLLKEVSTQTYNYGCVMLYFDFPEINKIHTAIEPKDVYTEDEDKSFGLEDEPHTTLLYGLHEDVTDENVKEILDGHSYGECTIYNASLFENEKYDVLKFDVSGNGLKETNKELQKYPFTSDYPEYHPHLTIGYLHPGKGKKYTKLLQNREYKLIPKYAVYSKPDGSKTKMTIKKKGPK